MSMSCSTFCCRELYIASAIFLLLCLTDWEVFESRFNTPHNLRTIALGNAPVDTVLTVLSGRVEEVEPNIIAVCRSL